MHVIPIEEQGKSCYNTEKFTVSAITTGGISYDYYHQQRIRCRRAFHRPKRCLGIEFYDRDIIKATVAESGLEMPEVERVEEEITRTGILLRMIAPAAYVDQQDTIRSIEQHVIVELAMKGPCVILGRCADEIMAKANIPSLNVFLYASDIHRAARIGKLINSTNPTEIQKKMQKTDAARRTYYEQLSSSPESTGATAGTTHSPWIRAFWDMTLAST